MDTIRVVIVDDHTVVRQGLCSLLAQYSDIQVVGESEGGLLALELLAQLQPDVVLLDIRLAGPSGLELARRIRRMPSGARVMILTSYDDEGYLLEAAQAGVRGYLLKSASTEVLAESIRAVYAGEERLSPELGGKALRQLGALVRTQAQSEVGLTDQELRLLQLIAEGASVQDMVHQMYLSERTLKRKTQDVLGKLGATSRAQAVAEAFRRGLL